MTQPANDEPTAVSSPRQQIHLRFAAWVVVIVLIAISPMLIHAVLNLRSNTTDMHQWLPSGRPEVRRYDAFTEHFGGDDVVLVSWPGCTLKDPRLPKFADALRAAVADDPEPVWRSVITGPETMRELIRGPAELRPGQAAARIYRVLLGEDKQTTAALITLTHRGASQPHQVIDLICRISLDSVDLPREQLRLAGSVYKATMIDRATDQAVSRCIVPSALITLFVAAVLLRSTRLTLVVLVASAVCATISVAMIHYTSQGINAILVAVPILLYVLTVSGAIHLANYYRDARIEVGKNQAGFRAVQVGWKPCALASASTAIGMASLIVSNLAPIRHFGIYSSAAVIIGFFVLMAVFAAVLTLSPCVHSLQHAASATRVNPWLDRVIGMVLRHHNALLVTGMIGLVAAGWGLQRTTTTVDIISSFRPESEVARNYHWLSEHIGPQGSFEMMLYYPQDSSLRLIDRLQQIHAVESVVRQCDGIGPTISALTFAPTLPRSHSIQGIATMAAFESRFAAARAQIISEGWLAETDQGEAWRIHIRTPETNIKPYSDLIDDLRERIKPIFADVQNPVEIEFTGGSPLISEAQAELLDDLTKSFLLAFAILAPVMMLLMRSFSAGLITMLPNLAPVVTVFGILGWLGIPIGLGTMLTASVALGIAVDDTLHFLTWYRRALREGLTRHEAIRSAFHRCAMAMLQTTLICCAGMLLLLSAEFIPTSMFAMMMIVLLPIALIGDLVLLPALLASPIGQAFQGTKSL